MDPNITTSQTYTYIVKCSDDTLYTGWTNDLEKRIQAHNAGKGAKYTKSRRPVALVYYETFQTKEDAMRREWEIKQLSRRRKLQLLDEQTSLKSAYELQKNTSK